MRCSKTEIFGSDRNEEKGIVNCSGQDEFLSEVIAASDKWDDLARLIHPGKEPEVCFRANIEEDMNASFSPEKWGT